MHWSRRVIPTPLDGSRTLITTVSIALESTIDVQFHKTLFASSGKFSVSVSGVYALHDSLILDCKNSSKLSKMTCQPSSPLHDSYWATLNWFSCLGNLFRTLASTRSCTSWPCSRKNLDNDDVLLTVPSTQLTKVYVERTVS